MCLKGLGWFHHPATYTILHHMGTMKRSTGIFFHFLGGPWAERPTAPSPPHTAVSHAGTDCLDAMPRTPFGAAR